MRILFIHNYYQMAGGEDQVVAAEIHQLRSAGHDVSVLFADNATIVNGVRRLYAAFSSVFSVTWFFRVLWICVRHRPAVVHVHNFFPLISPSVIWACWLARVPVCLTLHNYRIICPTSTLSADGRAELKSLTGSPWWGVRRRVYRDSFAGTFFLCAMISTHRTIGTWARLSKIIVLTEFAASVFSRWGGLPMSRVVVKSNSCADPLLGSGSQAHAMSSRRNYLFVGRLTLEKGVGVLLEAARLAAAEGVVVDLVGPHSMELIDVPSNVVVHGELDRQSVIDFMLRSRALVVPSLWFEGLPMVIVEAFACGLPVVASRIGSLSELVSEDVGVLFQPGDTQALASVLVQLSRSDDAVAQKGAAARSKYLAHFSPDRNVMALTEIYNSLLRQV